MNHKDVLSLLQGGLIVSCQAYPGEILFGSDMMTKFALTAEEGGAAGIRANSPEDISAIKSNTILPVIGIWKKSYGQSPVYITPTLQDALAVAEAGADMIAIDATVRERPNKERLEDVVEQLKKRYDGLLMADVSTAEEGRRAEQIGFDVISTTLSGYTPYSPQQELPDTKLIEELVASVSVPVFAEGRISTTDQAKECISLGAYAVVVGSAITRPQLITKWFADSLKPSAHIT